MGCVLPCLVVKAFIQQNNTLHRAYTVVSWNLCCIVVSQVAKDRDTKTLHNQDGCKILAPVLSLVIDRPNSETEKLQNIDTRREEHG